jgi:hypothetical protein
MMMEAPKEPADPIDSQWSQSSKEGRNQSSNVAVLVRGSNSELKKVSTILIRFTIGEICMND